MPSIGVFVWIPPCWPSQRPFRLWVNEVVLLFKTKPRVLERQRWTKYRERQCTEQSQDKKTLTKGLLWVLKYPVCTKGFGKTESIMLVADTHVAARGKQRSTLQVSLVRHDMFCLGVCLSDFFSLLHGLNRQQQWASFVSWLLLDSPTMALNV